jgi:Velvet factor
MLTDHLHSEIDISFLLLTVDLWDAEGLHENNLVRHTHGSPNINSSAQASYPPQSPTPPAYPYPQQGNGGYQQPGGAVQHNGGGYGQPQQMSGLVQQNAPSYGYGAPNGQQQHNGGSNVYQQQNGYQNGGISNGLTPSPMYPPQQQPPPQTAPGMYTRNLIGSLCASAFKLTDTDNVMSVWFILQDLSVRTEGTFRYVLRSHRTRLQ